MFSNLYPPVVSGSSTQTFGLSRELTRRGHKVVVITARVDPSSPKYEETDGVIVYRLPALRLPKLAIALNFPWLNFTFSPSTVHQIGNILARHKPDILHLHNHMFDLGLSAALMCRRTGLPLVTTLHTVIRHSQKLYNLMLYPADRLFLKWLVVNQSDQLICPDVNIKNYAQEAFGRSDPVIVPYGVDLPGLSDDGRIKQIRDTYNLNGKRIILSLGHVHEIRNRQDLVAALPDVLRFFPDTVLLIVGAVSTTTTEKLVHSLGVDHAVVFTGPVSHQSVPDFLAVADLEAHWLNQEEPEHTSLGIASLEAMLAGKVVLAAANPDTYGPGILVPGENILIVKPGHPHELARTIIELLQNDAHRLAIGQRASQTIREHFSWDSICELTIQVYGESIRKRRLADVTATVSMESDTDRTDISADQVNPSTQDAASTATKASISECPGSWQVRIGVWLLFGWVILIYAFFFIQLAPYLQPVLRLLRGS